MIYYYAVTKTTAKQTISEIANYGKSTSIGQALIDLQPVGFVTFFLEITEDDYNLLIVNLKQLENRQSQYNEAVRIWSEDMRMKKCSRVIN